MNIVKIDKSITGHKHIIFNASSIYRLDESEVVTEFIDKFLVDNVIEEIDYLEYNDLEVLQSFEKHLSKIKLGSVKAFNQPYDKIKWLNLNGCMITAVSNHLEEVIDVQHLTGLTHPVTIYFEPIK
jgi:hypothetical protein